MQSKGYYAVQGHSRVTISAALPLKTVPRASRSRLTTRNAPSYQILAQSNNPQLVENLRAVPIRDFVLGGLQSLHCLCGPITHLHTKFKQNQTINGWVTSRPQQDNASQL